MSHSSIFLRLLLLIKHIDYYKILFFKNLSKYNIKIKNELKKKDIVVTFIIFTHKYNHLLIIQHYPRQN